MVGTGCVATSLREFFDGTGGRIGSFRAGAAARLCSPGRTGPFSISWAANSKPNKIAPGSRPGLKNINGRGWHNPMASSIAAKAENM